MERVLSFFKSRWTKLGFSLLSPLYGGFCIWLAWLTFTHFLVPTNPVSLFSLYLFINVVFGGLMIYTRRQILTRIVACVLHPCVMVMLVFAFGNWYLLIPPFVVATIVFFASGSGETLKIVLGTLYLLAIVVEILAYLVMQSLTIELPIDMMELDMNLRQPDYAYSPDGRYRLVKYIDDPDKDKRKVKYYVEPAYEDIELPFLECEMFAGCEKILTSPLDANAQVRWVDNTRIYCDGVIKYVSLETDETDSDGNRSTSSDETSRAATTTRRTSATTVPEAESDG
jgi:hypothetical protein